jgi:hypothetical protein
MLTQVFIYLLLQGTLLWSDVLQFNLITLARYEDSSLLSQLTLQLRFNYPIAERRTKQACLKF